jgi:hypothetical protein
MNYSQNNLLWSHRPAPSDEGAFLYIKQSLPPSPQNLARGTEEKVIPQLMTALTPSLIVVSFLYMARRKLEDRNIRKLYKHSNGSFIVTLPIEAIRALKWRDGQKIVIERSGKTITIKDWKG